MRVAALVLSIMGGLAGLGLILGACGAEDQDESTPKSIAPSQQTQEEELPQGITWTTVQDEDEAISMSVPSEWETNTNVEELSAEFPALVESGLVPFFKSIDTETGSNLMVIMDAQYIFAEEAIDEKAYIQLQLEDIKQLAGTSGISTHAITIDGIKGTQIRYTLKLDGNELLGQSNILIGNEPRMLCGYMAILVQGIYGSAQSNVIEEGIESFRVLPTAAGDLESCD